MPRSQGSCKLCEDTLVSRKPWHRSGSVTTITIIAGITASIAVATVQAGEVAPDGAPPRPLTPQNPPQLASLPAFAAPGRGTEAATLTATSTLTATTTAAEAEAAAEVAGARTVRR
mmetsp:Transcript_17603/g.37687  ORF Transcript_17603/g.37687 Transcript_17603/m.37687 type:complete len:116 (+) Transcript_17603:753-1100(+)